MKYKAPEGVTSINVGGEQFDVDDLGHITVPADGNYAVLVASHGFVPADAGETSSEQAAGDERPARGRKPAAPSGQETSTTTAQADSEG